MYFKYASSLKQQLYLYGQYVVKYYTCLGLLEL
jgi:hypothetical protein